MKVKISIVVNILCILLCLYYLLQFYFRRPIDLLDSIVLTIAISVSMINNIIEWRRQKRGKAS